MEHHPLGGGQAGAGPHGEAHPGDQHHPQGRHQHTQGDLNRGGGQCDDITDKETYNGESNADNEKTK